MLVDFLVRVVMYCLVWLFAEALNHCFDLKERLLRRLGRVSYWLIWIAVMIVPVIAVLLGEWLVPGGLSGAFGNRWFAEDVVCAFVVAILLAFFPDGKAEHHTST